MTTLTDPPLLSNFSHSDWFVLVKMIALHYFFTYEEIRPYSVYALLRYSLQVSRDY